MRTAIFIGLTLIILHSSSSANAEETKSCSQVHLTESVTIDRYVFETYESTDPDNHPACLRILSAGRVVYTLVDHVQRYSLGQPGDSQFHIPKIPNGTDLTGDGHPNMIVTSWSGGAHCCFTHYVFELEPRLRLLAKIVDGNTDLAHFEKLDEHSGYYYVTYDIWPYWPASFASSTGHKVLLKWDGEKFKLDLNSMMYHQPSSQQRNAELKDVDDALKDGGEVRGALGVTLWDTVLDLIYTGHSDLAWKLVQEANPDALKGDNPTLEDFCVKLKSDQYWPDLKRTITEMPEECARAKAKSEN